jgi:hypothetical protein
VASARYGGGWGLKLGVWLSGDDVTPQAPKTVVGADYVLATESKKWRVGVGIDWIDGENNINGTRWNVDVSVAFDVSDQVFLLYQHYSHGSGLGIRKDQYNLSWNLFGIGYAF